MSDVPFIGRKQHDEYSQWVTAFIKKTRSVEELTNEFNLFPEKGKRKIIKKLGEETAAIENLSKKSKK